jgi:hypothetical protein
MPQARFAETLRLLASSDVEFIVVGMTAGILQGVPLSTLDVHIVHRRSPDNVARLLRVLREIDAVYRHDPRRLPPQESHLLSEGHQLLTTSHGDLDCLGSLGDRIGFEELLEQTVTLDLGTGLSVRVLKLPALIAAKERAGRPKDVAALPVLRATLDELNRRS